MTKDKLILEAKKEFDKKFIYTRYGQWLRAIDGYEDENGKFIKKPHEAYAVPEFIQDFISTQISKAYDAGIEAVEKVIPEKRDSKDYDSVGRHTDCNIAYEECICPGFNECIDDIREALEKLKNEN